MQPSIKCSQESPAPNQSHVAPQDRATGLLGVPKEGVPETGDFPEPEGEPDSVWQGKFWNSLPSF